MRIRNLSLWDWRLNNLGHWNFRLGSERIFFKAGMCLSGAAWAVCLVAVIWNKSQTTDVLVSSKSHFPSSPPCYDSDLHNYLRLDLFVFRFEVWYLLILGHCFGQMACWPDWFMATGESLQDKLSDNFSTPAAQSPVGQREDLWALQSNVWSGLFEFRSLHHSL